MAGSGVHADAASFHMLLVYCFASHLPKLYTCFDCELQRLLYCFTGSPGSHGSLLYATNMFKNGSILKTLHNN
jgi:hypothetical protein